MCTASWLTAGATLHFFFNRDELRARRRALPPTLHRNAEVSYLAPTDALAGGTWIAATERGAVLALLNKSDGLLPAAAESRGTLIPLLAPCRSPDELVEAFSALKLDRYAPFRLAALWCHLRSGVALAWNGRALKSNLLDPQLGLLASSGLGDARAEATRGETWCRRRQAAPHWSPADHRLFHRDHAPRRSAWSVCVHRREAQTVSYTEIDLSPAEIRLRYVAGSPCLEGVEVAQQLRFAPSG